MDIPLNTVIRTLKKMAFLPHKTPKVTEDYFYTGSFTIAVEHHALSFSLKDFNNHYLRDLPANLEPAAFKKLITELGTSSGPDGNYIGTFGLILRYLIVKASNGTPYLAVVCSTESQPGVFWVGIEGVWEVLA